MRGNNKNNHWHFGWHCLLTSLAVAMISWGAFVTITKAEVRIDINRGNVQPLPIALVDFSASDPSLNAVGQNIIQVIQANLSGSGLFSPIDRQAFITPMIDIQVRPNFSDWRLINAQALVNGHVTLTDTGAIRVEFRLWDVFAETQMLGLAFSTDQGNWRRVSHIISDAIYKRITGEEGYFDSRIVYIAENGPANDRVKRLAIMDQDGANHQFLTDGSALVLTPRFSPITQEITYLSYFNNAPRVYLFNIQTGEQQILGAFRGMTFAPRFSPSGKQVIMSYASDGSSDIYELDLETKQTVQLTRTQAIDTAPSYSPDGEFITFESDRGGAQQLYVMRRDGSEQKRISFGKGSYATPVWSPRGDLIAFTKLLGGEFYIGVMRPDGRGERLLVKGYHNEGPTWSPNGRVILFFRETPQPDGSRTSHILSVDLTGRNVKRLITPTDGSDPAWGPLNP